MFDRQHGEHPPLATFAEQKEKSITLRFDLIGNLAHLVLSLMAACFGIRCSGS